MKFIQVTPERAVNVDSIDMVTKDIDGFAVVHLGLESFRANFPYDSLISLLSINQEERGNGPNPTATALAY